MGPGAWASHWPGRGHVPAAGANQCRQPLPTLNSGRAVVPTPKKRWDALTKMGENHNGAGREKAGAPCTSTFMLFQNNLLIEFLLEYSCFILLCHCLLYSKVNQPHAYIYPLFLGFPSHLGYHGAPRRVLCAI